MPLLSIIPDYAYVEGIIHAAWINVVPWPLSGLLGCRIDLPHVKYLDLPSRTCQNCPTCWRNRSPHNVSREVSAVAVSALRLKDERHQCYALAAQERPPPFLLLSANYIVHWWRWRRRFIHSHSGCLCCVISMSNLLCIVLFFVSLFHFMSPGHGDLDIVGFMRVKVLSVRSILYSTT